MLGTVDRQGSLLGVDSLLSRLFEGDESSFYARMAAHGATLIRINPREPQGPGGTISLAMGARDAVERIQQLIDDT